MSANPETSGSAATPETPWLGLRSFTEEARLFFFGRNAEVDDLYARILDKPLAILFGQSGLGKSSLLQAALIPRLREGGFLPVFLRLDHDATAPPLEHQLLDRLQMALTSAGFGPQAATVGAALAPGTASGDFSAFLWLLFHDPAKGFVPARGDSTGGFPRPVFLIDQFEEVFTLGERPARRDLCLAFRETLAALVENRPPGSLRGKLEADDALAERLDYNAQPARFLLALREDFLHLLERWRRAMPSLMENRLELRLLSGPQAFLAVVRPGQLRAVLPAIITDDVGHAIVRFVAGANGDVPLEEIDAVPPLVSLVCAELNAQRLASSMQQVTRAQFEGGSDDILQSFYLRSFDLVTYGATFGHVPHAEMALLSLRGLVEDRLLSADGFRESIAFDTIESDLARAVGPEAAKAVLDALVQRRLLTVEERGGVRRLELAHDVLTRTVKSSRDERREVEALARARSEKEHAEAETRRILKERNRFKMVATLATCLAIILPVSAIIGWVGLQRTKEAEHALAETKRAWGSESKAVAAEKSASLAKTAALEALQQAKEDRESAVDSENKAVIARKEAQEAAAQAVADQNRAIASRNEAVEARKEADKSAQLAVDAQRKAQVGFESAWTGLTSLYDDYATKTLDNTPGISRKQSRLLKAALRGHLLEQFRKLNAEHPNHRGTVQYLAQLLLDEGREAIADKDYIRAQTALAEALSWSEKRLHDEPLQTESETYAEVLLEQAMVSSGSGEPKKGAELARKYLQTVLELLSKWPDSWRLDYTKIRLEYAQLLDGAPRQSFAALTIRLAQVIKRSNNQFDPVLTQFIIECRENDGKRFKRGSADYVAIRNLIVWFREHLFQDNSYTFAQLETATMRMQDLLASLQTWCSETNSKETAADRRVILAELETTMQAINARLPSSTVAYVARGDLLRLQEMSVKEGINTLSREELRAVAQKQAEGAGWKPKMTAMQRDAVIAVLKKHLCKGLFITPDIPPKKLSTARESCNIAPDYEALALVDATVFGSAKNCLVVTTGGVYTRNGPLHAHPGRQFLSLNDFQVSSPQKESGKIYFNPWDRYVMIAGMHFVTNGGCRIPANDLITLLQEIQHALRGETAMTGQP
jgi:hypothetical protein